MHAAPQKIVNRIATPVVQRATKPAPAAQAVRNAVVLGRMQLAGTMRVSSPSDPAEREAEETARRVMRMPRREAPGFVAPKPNASALRSPLAARMASAIVQRQPIIARKAEGQPNVSNNVAAEISASQSAGQPLPPSVRRFMEPRFDASFKNVRIHSGDRAAKLNRQVSARAFTVGNQIFFGRGQFQPNSSDGRELIAHELTHTIQQGAVIQRSADVTIGERTEPHVQRLGLSDALNYFAEKANYIPGFRMFTIVLGVNPINMSRVERSPANIMRAIVEFLPGGALIVQALDNHGVFDKVGNWVAQQIASLGMVGGAIKKGIDAFLDSLSWTDIFDLGGVWERAKRIFTEPIGQLITFVKGLAVGIITFIKDAILMPIAKLAQGTRGYDLLCAVLGKDPVTGQAVPQTPETLIGGFMKFIGQEDVWENMKRANALPRAFAWFKGAMAALMSMVQQIPTLFLNAFKALEIMDIVLLPRAFAKLVGVFGNFVGSFISWAGNAVWNLLEIIFDVVSPGALSYIKRTGAALKSILKNPLPFVGNLVKAAKQGFLNFAKNFGTHLKAGLIDWLTGSLPGVYIPKAFSLGEIVKFVLSVLGISWQNVRTKLVKVLGEPVVKAMEIGFDIVVVLVTQGPAAAWEKIQEHLTNLKDMVIGGITDFVIDMVVQKAIPKLIAMFIPGAGFISAILSIYDTIMVFVNKISKIIQVVTGFINSIVAIAAGNIGAAASRVESILAGLLSLAINFLAGFIGLGKVADKIMGLLNKVRATIDKALDGLVNWIVTMGKKLFGALKAGAKSLLEWWKVRKAFDANGARITLYTEGSEDSYQLLIASSPGKPWTEYLNFPKAVKDKVKDKKPYTEAMRLAKEIESKRARITEPDPVKRDKAKAQAASDLEAKFNQLAVQIELLNGLIGAKTPASVITFYGVDSLGGGIKATASILSKNHPPGSGPGDYAAIWNQLEGLGAGTSKRIRQDWYVQGHLLNENLGGPGMRFNLTPITKEANNLHKSQVENDVKKKVNDEGKVVYYQVWVETEWGKLSFSRLDTLERKKKDGTAEPRELRELAALETLGKLTRGFACEGYELEDDGNGNWKKKPGGYTVPNKTIPNQVKVGDKPYGY